MRGTMQLFAGTCLAILLFLLLNVNCMAASKAPAGQSQLFLKITGEKSAKLFCCDGIFEQSMGAIGTE
jgi:hypothetical protein